MDGLAQRRAAAAHVFVDPAVLDTDIAHEVDDDTAHHLRRVLRLRPGATLTETDGAGRWRVVRYVEGALLDPDGPVEIDDRGEPFTIATAIPKGDRIDVLVQKVAELGADRVVLLHTDHSVVRWPPDRAARQVARLSRIADEACRQSRRTWRTEVVGPLDASDVLGDAVVAEPGGRPLEPTDRLVAIGPEGGWTDREIASAAGTVDLGGSILRTETAAIAATTLCVVKRH